MILLVDSGSTKSDWWLADSKGKVIQKQKTLGINPVMFTPDEIKERISLASDILAYAHQVTQIYFYGAGCGLITNQNLIRTALLAFYSRAEVEVQSDLVAAVRATATEPGIVCILGTGSNSCYFDGKNIHFGFDSLGYSVMDEASGNYFGKQLLRDYFYKRMPVKIAKQFESRFDLTTDKILLHLYKEHMPAKYLASFAKFIFEIGLTETYVINLLEKGFVELVEYQLMLWPNYKEVPIHFIGSIAYFAKEELRNTLSKRGVTAGRIQKAPIHGLYNYHIREIKK